VAHVELSLSESSMPAMPGVPDWSTVDRWAMAVEGANEPCVVIDGLGVITAASESACQLLGFRGPSAAVGLCVFSGVLPLVDFTAEGLPLPEGDLQRIPPVLAVTSGRLARGLMRVRTGVDVITMDAVSTPLFDERTVVGSLTFFCEV
jgi:PAS domain-containing protein